MTDAGDGRIKTHANGISAGHHDHALRLSSSTCNNPFSPSETLEHDRLAGISTLVFSRHLVDFDVIDFYQRPDDATERRVLWQQCRADNAEEVLASPLNGARVRIISIAGLGTTSPLHLTYPLACQLWSQYGLEPEFRELLYAFGRAPNAACGGTGNAFVKSYADGSTTWAYSLQHLEKNGRSAEKPWSHRHAAVYHRFVPKQKDEEGQPFDFFILVHSTGESQFASELNSLRRRETGRDLYGRMMQSPFCVHEMLLDSVLRNWTWYLRERGEEYTRTTKDLFATYHPSQRPDSLDFEPYRALRIDREETLAALSYCEGLLDSTEILLGIRQRLKLPFDEWGTTVRQRVKSCMNGLTGLQARLVNAIELLEHALSSKATFISSDMNQHMVDLTRYTVDLTKMTHALTQNTVDDSAAVKIITILGLIYLPGTFVSGLFGMNFFDYSSDANLMTTATNTWIYVILWLPLTILTIALYLYLNQRRKKEMRARNMERLSLYSQSPRTSGMWAVQSSGVSINVRDAYPLRTLLGQRDGQTRAMAVNQSTT